jgi:hypothetical protein
MGIYFGSYICSRTLGNWYYECEIQTWEYPKAALFSFCLVWVTYNILATVRAVYEECARTW